MAPEPTGMALVYVDGLKGQRKNDMENIATSKDGQLRIGVIFLGHILFLTPTLFYGIEIVHRQLIANVRKVAVKTS